MQNMPEGRLMLTIPTGKNKYYPSKVSNTRSLFNRRLQYLLLEERSYNNKYYYGNACFVEHMHFQLLHKPRCFRSGIRTMRVNSREPRQPQYLRRCGKSHFRGWPSGLWHIWRVSSRDTTLRGRPGATDVRALSKNRELLTMLGLSTIKSARWNEWWQVLPNKGKIFFPKVSGKSFHNLRRYDSRRQLRRMRIWPATCFFFLWSSTHTSEHREVKYPGQKKFGSGLKSPFLSNIGHYFHFFHR
jgi:hypothetical protein